MNLILGIILTIFSLTPKAYAAINYGSGVYTNLCGTGMNATADTCIRGCNVSSGFCSTSESTVVKYWCDGRLAQCSSNESPFATTQSLGNTPCGKTVEIDVYNKTCRVNGEWTCNDQNKVDYMVWYSGDCSANATVAPTVTSGPTITPNPTTTPSAYCSSLTITSGNNAFVPANVQFSLLGTPNANYRIYFGDGGQQDTNLTQFTHQYTTSGTFQASAVVLDTQNAIVPNSSCQTTVTVKAIPLIESQQSACSNVIISQGNGTMAPATVKFSVTGFDNKGTIQKYKLDYGNGTEEESTQSAFQKIYAKAGTYDVKGYIYDSQNVWKGGTGTCNVSLNITTATMSAQPDTGTPTWFTIAGLSSGFLGFILLKFRKTLALA